VELTILYRGPLLSCNYGCDYCPFAKRKNTRAELAEDRAALTRFIDWVEARPHLQISVLITPWGEALIRAYYQAGLVRLSHLPNVRRAAIQTNLSAPTAWAAEANRDVLALWSTFHPEWTTQRKFLNKVHQLDALGVRLSVGMVGFERLRPDIEAMRAALPPHLYLWINAVKDELPTQSPETAAAFEAIDPLYPYNTRRYPSLGHPCRAGDTVISVRGDGEARRCHFIPEPIGNIYAPDFEAALYPRLCTAATCHCHIGYVHMPELNLYDTFQRGVLERIPHAWPAPPS
jgi:MoaA/NifB/PqqE/SkfB family radical SAM enzyme